MRLIRPASVLLNSGELRFDVILGVGADCGDDPPLVRYLENDDEEVQIAVAEGVEVENRGGELWTEAPLMMHAHLESWDAPSDSWQRESFSSWVKELLQWRQSDSRLSAQEALKRSWGELSEHGCGGVLATNGEPDIDVYPSNRIVAAGEWFMPESRDAEGGWQAPEMGPFAALHSPFGVSEQLAAAAVKWMQQGNRLLSIHLGEHEDERQFLASGEGPLAELMQARGRAFKHKRWPSAVDWLCDISTGRLDGLLAVHCGDLCADELKRLTTTGAEVVWCPGTHLYFDRPKPNFAAAGLPAPMLGCDSRASNAELNPMRELRLARQIVPQYTPQQWWNAATTHARAFWPGPAPLPLRFADPGLRSAAEVCDYLTSEPDLKPLAPPGIPSPGP